MWRERVAEESPGTLNDGFAFLQFRVFTVVHGSVSMAQTPGAIPGQAVQAAPIPRRPDDQAGEPESLMAILKRASGPGENGKRPPKLATVRPPEGAAAEQAREPARPPAREPALQPAR